MRTLRSTQAEANQSFVMRPPQAQVAAVLHRGRVVSKRHAKGRSDDEGGGEK